jgi:hypothetical protein
MWFVVYHNLRLSSKLLKLNNNRLDGKIEPILFKLETGGGSVYPLPEANQNGLPL